MRHRPIVLRLLAALVLAFGLLGSVITPALAQDEATPTPEESDAQSEDIVFQAGVETGSLLLNYYLCDGGAGFLFQVANPGEASPTTPVDDCALASAADATDATFLVYEFGDLNSTPHELTTVDGVVQDDTLPVTDGTLHKITQKLPDGSQETPIEADFAIQSQTVTAVNAVQFQVGTVELHKFQCTGDPAESFIQALNPGEELDEAPYADCSPASHDFTIQPFDDAENFDTIALTTEGGVASDENVPTTSPDSAQHKITEDNTELTAAFDVEAGQTTILVAVNYVQATGDLTINKLQCIGDEDTQFYIDEDPPQIDNPDCSVADAEFSIYLFGDMESDPVDGDTSGGSTDVTGLPVTDADPHVLVEDETGAQTEFVISEGATTVINVVNFVPPPAEDGTVEIEKLACSGLWNPVIEVGNPGDEPSDLPDNCSDSSADFVIYPFSDDEAEPIEFTVNGFESMDLPPTEGTPHMLVELDGSGDPIATEFFEIESGDFTPVQVQNPTFGKVKIYSYWCDGDEDSWFEVFDPGEVPTLPQDCDPLERNFDITYFGSGDSETLATGWDGVIWLTGVPATDAAGHVISKGGGIEETFYVDANETTYIISYVQEGDTGGVTDDSDDSENVDQLADTGVGPASRDDTATLLYGLLSVVAVIGIAAATRRRAA